MSSIGKALLRFNQLCEQLAYRKLLSNGWQVSAVNGQVDSGLTPTGLAKLDFRSGATFGVRDSLSAAHTFREIFLRGDYNVPQLRSARNILDVGANIGLFTYFAHQKAPKSRIHAFEADPDTFPILQSNVTTFAKGRVQLTNAAVASENGYIDFFGAEVSGWSSKYPTLGAAKGLRSVVPAIKLSEYVKKENIQSVDVAKIDVEGAEYDILLGDSALWDIPIRALLVEIDRNPRSGIPYGFPELLQKLKEKFSSVQERKGGDYPVFFCFNG